MNEFDVDLRLDEDFLFIFNFSRDILTNLTDRPQENELCQQWLSKLCVEKVEGVHAKRLRNNYLVRLLSFLREGKLSDPFLVPPKEGALDPLPVIEVGDKEPPWLKQLIHESERDDDMDAAKDCRIYLNTKVFEENRGACAYMAISVADEGDVPHWIQTGDPGILQKHLAHLFRQLNLSAGEPGEEPPEIECSEGQMKEYRQFVVDAIQDELSGQVEPKSNWIVEELLDQFIKTRYDNPAIFDECAKLPEREQRNFLLMQLKSMIYNEIE